MKNADAWEQEYRRPKFLTLGTEPLAAVRDFLKWLRRKQKVAMAEFTILDLGCGNGKNLRYAVEEFAEKGIGYDISPTAIAQARQLKGEARIDYQVRSIGAPYPLGDESVDLVFDVTSSNALNESERETCLSETARVMKHGGYLFLRTLCLEGDTNAKNLIKQFPGAEKDTYILAETGITERAFSREDLVGLYSRFFEVVSLEKSTGYQRWGNQSYKRNYWVAYLKKK